MADGGAEARAPNDPSAAIEAYVLLRDDARREELSHRAWSGEQL
jgi:hypothetical protein